VSDRRTSPPGGADGRGVPTAARARLAAELHEELARTRLAWAAATLRGDAARQTGDRAGAERALDEQRTLLRDLHLNIDTVVGRALLEREVAAIVAAPPEPSGPEGSPAAVRPGVGRRSVRGRVGAALGAVVAAVAGALVVGAPQTPPAPSVAPVAADAADADDRVTVAGDRVQPLDAAVARLSAVLAELGTRLRDAPDGPTGPGASATSDRAISDADGGSRPDRAPGADDRGSDRPSQTTGQAEPSERTGVEGPAEEDGTGPSEEDQEVRVDVPTRTDEVEGTLDELLGPDPAPGDGALPAPNLRLELDLPSLAEEDGGHLSFRPATG
jgi:hypothetical protein